MILLLLIAGFCFLVPILEVLFFKTKNALQNKNYSPVKPSESGSICNLQSHDQLIADNEYFMNLTKHMEQEISDLHRQLDEAKQLPLPVEKIVEIEGPERVVYQSVDGSASAHHLSNIVNKYLHYANAPFGSQVHDQAVKDAVMQGNAFLVGDHPEPPPKEPSKSSPEPRIVG